MASPEEPERLFSQFFVLGIRSFKQNEWSRSDTDGYERSSTPNPPQFLASRGSPMDEEMAVPFDPTMSPGSFGSQAEDSETSARAQLEEVLFTPEVIVSAPNQMKDCRESTVPH